MARIFQDGFDLNSTTVTLNGWDTWAGSAIGTTHVRTGTYAMQVASLVSATSQGNVKKWLGTAANGPYFLRAYIYVVTLPSGNNTIMSFTASSTLGNSMRCSIILASDGTLKLFNGTSTGTQIGSASAAINDGAWHMIELKTDTTAASGSRVIEGRLDGSVFATSSAQSQSSSLAFSLGGNLGLEAQTTGEWWFDDVALNDNSGASQTSYPGSGKIITMRPNATGDANGWTTNVGGTAGAANNYTRVNEVTPDDNTSYNGAAFVNTTDMFNMDASGTGSSDTINAVQLNARFKNPTADAVCAVKFQIEKTASGTKAQSAAIIPNTTSWNTNGTAVPRLPVLTLYADPDAAAWTGGTGGTLDSMQAGYIISTTGSNGIDVTNLWVTVDYTPAGGVLHTQSLSGTLSFAGAMNLQTSHNMTATLSFAGAITRAASHGLAATLSFAGGLNRFLTKTAFPATLYFAGNLARSLRRGLAATVSFAGALGPTVIHHTMSATLSFAGTIKRAVSHNISGVLSFAGAITRALTKGALAATLSFAGAFSSTKLFIRSLTGTLSFAGALGAKSIGKSLTGALNLTASTRNLIAHTLDAATLSFVGTLTKNVVQHALNAYVRLLGGYTNRTTHSQDFSNWAHDGSPITVTDNVYVAPDGTTTASSVTAAGIDTGIHNPNSLGFVAGDVATYSVYLKYVSGGTNWLIGAHSVDAAWVSFNISTGAFVAVSNAAFVEGYSITNVGNGWYKITLTTQFRTNNGNFIIFNNTGTNPTVAAVWGAQVEYGTVANPYLVTTTTIASSDFLTLILNRPLAATLSFAGSLNRAVSHGLTATLSFAGALTRALSHTLTGVLSFLGVFTAVKGGGGTVFTQSLFATLSFAGNLSRATSKQMGSSLSFAGSLTRALAKTALTAALGLSGAFSTLHRHFVSLAGVLSFSGLLKRPLAKAFNATLSFAGRVTKAISGITFTATLGLVGSFIKYLPVKTWTYIKQAISGTVKTETTHGVSKPITLSGTEKTDIVSTSSKPNNVQSSSRDTTTTGGTKDTTI